jgi:hypothetical protein
VEIVAVMLEMAHRARFRVVLVHIHALNGL